MSNTCPNPRRDALTSSHTMRLEQSDGEREIWYCITCGFTRIESRKWRCQRCGGFKHEPAPWWCQSGEHHDR